jgi:transcriptional regulator with XRE-family HTH domain
MRDLRVIRKKPAPGREPWSGVPLDLPTRLAFARAVGDRIGSLRQACGWNQQEMAKLCGISTSGICRIESGANPLDMNKLSAICSVLGVWPHTVVVAAEQAVGGMIVPRHQCALCSTWFDSVDTWFSHIENDCADMRVKRAEPDWRETVD